MKIKETLFCCIVLCCFVIACASENEKQTSKTNFIQMPYPIFEDGINGGQIVILGRDQLQKNGQIHRRSKRETLRRKRNFILMPYPIFEDGIQGGPIVILGRDQLSTPGHARRRWRRDVANPPHNHRVVVKRVRRKYLPPNSEGPSTSTTNINRKISKRMSREGRSNKKVLPRSGKSFTSEDLSGSGGQFNGKRSKIDWSKRSRVNPKPFVSLLDTFTNQPKHLQQQQQPSGERRRVSQTRVKHVEPVIGNKSDDLRSVPIDTDLTASLNFDLKSWEPISSQEQDDPVQSSSLRNQHVAVDLVEVPHVPPKNDWTPLPPQPQRHRKQKTNNVQHIVKKENEWTPLPVQHQHQQDKDQLQEQVEVQKNINQEFKNKQQQVVIDRKTNRRQLLVQQQQHQPNKNENQSEEQEGGQQQQQGQKQNQQQEEQQQQQAQEQNYPHLDENLTTSESLESLDQKSFPTQPQLNTVKPQIPSRFRGKTTHKSNKEDWSEKNYRKPTQTRRMEKPNLLRSFDNPWLPFKQQQDQQQLNEPTKRNPIRQLRNRAFTRVKTAEPIHQSQSEDVIPVEPIQQNVEEFVNPIQPIVEAINENSRESVEPVEQNLEPVQQNVVSVQENIEPVEQNVELVQQNEEPIQQNVEIKPVQTNEIETQPFVKKENSNYFGRSRKRSYAQSQQTVNKKPIQQTPIVNTILKYMPNQVRQTGEPNSKTFETTEKNIFVEEQIQIQLVNKNEVKNLEITIPFSRIQSMEHGPIKQDKDGNVKIHIVENDDAPNREPILQIEQIVHQVEPNDFAYFVTPKSKQENEVVILEEEIEFFENPVVELQKEPNEIPFVKQIEIDVVTSSPNIQQNNEFNVPNIPEYEPVEESSETEHNNQFVETQKSTQSSIENHFEPTAVFESSSIEPEHQEDIEMYQNPQVTDKIIYNYNLPTHHRTDIDTVENPSVLDINFNAPIPQPFTKTISNVKSEAIKFETQPAVIPQPIQDVYIFETEPIENLENQNIEKSDTKKVTAQIPRRKTYGRRDKPFARFGNKAQETVQGNISNFFNKLPGFVPKNKFTSSPFVAKNKQGTSVALLFAPKSKPAFVPKSKQQIGKRRLKFGERLEE